jgi:non-specific serine/threonine protein kinase
VHDSSGIRTFVFSQAAGTARPEQAVFGNVADALAAGIRHAAEGRRCGIHTGHCDQRGSNYYGAAVNRAAHIMAAAHPGQVLVSQSIAVGLAARMPPGTALRDLGLVRLRDLCRPERLYQLDAPGLASEFPALRSLDDVPNNLPEAAFSFIGRTREIADVCALLAGNRLVTLLGMSGVGKTRLALHAAAECFDAYRDGVWLVELAAVHEGEAVTHAVASVLGVRDCGDTPPEAALAAHVRSREMLVVLDNCEHVLEGAAQAACDLLAAGAGVRVLATSREPLRISHEARYLVPGLSIPAEGAARARDAIARYFAVRLFVDRAHAVMPRFGLTGDNAAVVASICKALDGIPLAIEIAAARLPDVGLAGVAAGVAARLRGLDHEVPTPERLLILLEMIDWSHGLLSPAARTLLRRLAVFAGGCSLDAARAVCMTEGDGDLREALGELTAKALLASEGDRYRMHESVREYALARLRQARELEATLARHLDFFSELAIAARPELAGPRQAQWLARLDDERANLLAAHARSLAADASALAGLRLANALKLYWMNRGLANLGLKLTLQSLARCGDGAPPADRCQGLFNAGQIRYFLGRHAEARECLERSLAIARAVAPARTAAVLQPLGMAALALGDRRAARACLEEAVAIARALDDRNSAAGALNALAMFHRVEGHPEQSRPLYEAVVRLAVESGNDEVQAIGLLNLAMVCVELDDPAGARRDLRSAMAVAMKIGSAPAGQAALDVCAGLACLARDWARGARHAGAADSQSARSGIARDAADTLFLEPKLARARAALGAAAYEGAYREGQRMGLEQALREARSWLEPAGESAIPALASR